MLNKLEVRFREAGYKNLQFIIINTSENHSSTFASTVAHNISIVRGPSEKFEPFQLLSAYVVDNCGRLVYIIYSPWSSIKRPYVKASILSTIYDAPCGECNLPYPESSYPDISTIITSTTVNPKLAQLNMATPRINLEFMNQFTSIDPSNNDSLTTNFIQKTNETHTEQSYDEDQDYILPLKIILPAEHAHPDPDHNGTFFKYNYILLNTNDTGYHGHLWNDNPENFTLGINHTGNLSTNTSIPLKILLNENGEPFESIKEHTIQSNNGDVTVTFDDIAPLKVEDITVESRAAPHENIVTPTSSNNDQKNDEHYGKILQWIHFNL